MYTSEFIEKVEALPFVEEIIEPISTGNTVVIKSTTNERILAFVETDEMNSVDTQYMGFTDLSDEEKSKLMSIIWQYISTPVDEREPEREFRLRAKELLNIRREDAYLNYFGYEGKLFVGTKEKVPSFKTIFTDSELKELFFPEQLEWIEMTFDKEVVE